MAYDVSFYRTEISVYLLKAALSALKWRFFVIEIPWWTDKALRSTKCLNAICLHGTCWSPAQFDIQLNPFVMRLHGTFLLLMLLQMMHLTVNLYLFRYCVVHKVHFFFLRLHTIYNLNPKTSLLNRRSHTVVARRDTSTAGSDTKSQFTLLQNPLNQNLSKSCRMDMKKNVMYSEEATFARLASLPVIVLSLLATTVSCTSAIFVILLIACS